MVEDRDEYKKKYRVLHKEYAKKYRKEYQKQHLSKVRTQQHKSNHKKILKKLGLTLDNYNEMFAKQSGCCAMCKKPQVKFKKRFAIDHNHKTGKVRGLLCSACNSTLGWYENNKDKIINYLERDSNVN